MRVVPLEMCALQQAAVVSCSQVNLDAQSALPYYLGFPRICGKCVGQRNDCSPETSKLRFSALSKHYV